MSPRAALQRFATPFTTGLFVVSTVSGVALFLHLGSSWFHSMHEILSMVLLVPVALHVWRNWTPLVNYARRGVFWIAMGVSLAAAVPFVVSAGSASGGNPAMAFVRAAQNAPLTALAPVLGVGEGEMLSRLGAAGVDLVQPGDSLTAIAARTGRTEFELLAALQKPAPAAAP